MLRFLRLSIQVCLNRLGARLPSPIYTVRLGPRLRLFLSRHHGAVTTPKAFRFRSSKRSLCVSAASNGAVRLVIGGFRRKLKEPEPAAQRGRKKAAQLTRLAVMESEV